MIYTSACICIEKSKEVLRLSDIYEKDGEEDEIYEVTKDMIINDTGSMISEDSTIKKAEDISIKIIHHAPKIFSFLRYIDGVTNKDIISSMLPENNLQELKETSGRGGGLFLNTSDSMYILKTVQEEELQLIQQQFAVNLAKYLNENPNSIISRIYGLFTIQADADEKTSFIIMKNVYGIFNYVKVKYDLKGSKLNREEKFELDKLQEDKNFQGKDVDFYLNEAGGLLLPQSQSNKLYSIAEKDSEFLCSQRVMDYSLFVVKVGLNREEGKALFGLQYRKECEREYNSIVGEEMRQTIRMENDKSIMSFPLSKEDAKIDFERVNFQLDKVSSLHKYIFPRLDGQNMYIIAIIDYFQLYGAQKKIETFFKGFKAKKDDISSMEPNGYQKRFMNLIKNITDTEHLLRSISKNNSNDE